MFYVSKWTGKPFLFFLRKNTVPQVGWVILKKKRIFTHFLKKATFLWFSRQNTHFYLDKTWICAIFMQICMVFCRNVYIFQRMCKKCLKRWFCRVFLKSATCKSVKNSVFWHTFWRKRAGAARRAQVGFHVHFDTYFYVKMASLSILARVLGIRMASGDLLRCSGRSWLRMRIFNSIFN